jgi:hypothetical protein
MRKKLQIMGFYGKKGKGLSKRVVRALAKNAKTYKVIK